MKHFARLVVYASVLLLMPILAWAQTVTFSDAPVGALPKSFTSALTGQGKPGRWEVIDDKTATGGKALAQLDADRTDYRFPLAIFETRTPADAEVTIRFKAISGQVDRAGGIAIRLRDPDNYYVARANALEDNVRFYRVVAGKRQQIAGANARVTANEWHTLSLRAQGDRFSVSFDGRELFSATDRTFAGEGRIALWTKADSVTRFGELTVKP